MFLKVNNELIIGERNQRIHKRERGWWRIGKNLIWSKSAQKMLKKLLKEKWRIFQVNY